jgi:hypothetical protein
MLLHAPSGSARKKLWASFNCLAAMVALVACSSDPPALYAEVWPEANHLFTRDAQWIGGDGAYSVDLGAGRVLWLFGDSFIATSSARVRAESRMIRNSVAIQHGYEPTRAFMQFFWRELERAPASFVPEDGVNWFWPGHGLRLEDRLLLFYGRVYQRSEGMWGFAPGAWTAFLVANPDADPVDWDMSEVSAASQGASVQLGGAVLRDGPLLYVYGPEGDRHDVYLARFDVAKAYTGDLTAPEWWGGSGWAGADQRVAIISPGAPEFSVHYAEPLGQFVFTQTEGFGASTIAIRTAPSPEGPWSEPRDLIRPPESFEPKPFVYAGKAHPELRGADLAVTYVPSSFEGTPSDVGESLYYPRFVKVSYR